MLTIVQSSHLVSAISPYLCNDSGHGAARPSIQSSSLASALSVPQVVPLILPNAIASFSSSSSRNGQSILSLLHKLENYLSSNTAHLAVEFDVYSPLDYPQSPIQVHLVTKIATRFD